MVRIGGGWNTLDNYLARCDPCRCQKHSVALSPTATATTVITSSSGQSATTSNTVVINEHQRRLLGDDQLDSSCNDPPSSWSAFSEETMTTSSRQRPTTRRLGDLSLTSQTIPVDNANCRPVDRRSPPTTTHYADVETDDVTDDVTLDSAAAEGCSSFCDNDDYGVTDRRSGYSTSTPCTSDNHVTALTSTSSSPSLAAAATATTSTALHTSCSCTRLLDARNKSADNRPSCIPVPLRLTAQCRCNNASFLRGDGVINSPATSTPAKPSCSCLRLLGLDDTRSKSVDSRPSCIPVPLRVAAQCPSHGATLFSGGGATNSPINRQIYSDRHRRCDSGVDLNLSSPDFD